MILLAIEIVFIVLLSVILYFIIRRERCECKNNVPKARVDGYLEGDDRRKYIRFKKALDATYRVKHKPNLRMQCKTVDISEGGLRLILDAKFSNGEVLHLVIDISEMKKAVELEGKVVWSEEVFDYKDPSGKRFFYAGLEFCGITDNHAQILADYIKKLSAI
ncbi:MAG: PilZ domain-containing protein [Candidatus Omnitrophica bacterium]|nr:PilZ domain-containing protein [Candidatus Omnitrophota bacterium]